MALTGKVIVVPIEKVQPPDNLLRTVKKNTEKYKQLLGDVAKNGFINIPLAKPGAEEGTYKMVEGNNRYSCAVDLGWKEIPIQVRDNISPEEEMLLQVSGNSKNIPTARGDYARQIINLMNMYPTRTKAEWAAELGHSVKWLEDILSLDNLYEQAFKLCNEGTINAVNAATLAKLPREEQVNFIENAITEKVDVFAGMVDARVKEIRDARRKGKAPGEAQFHPTAHMRTLSNLEEERKLKSEFVKHTFTNYADCWDAALAWAMSLDAESVAASKEKWEKKKAEEKANREKAARERLEKKLAEMAAPTTNQ